MDDLMSLTIWWVNSNRPSVCSLPPSHVVSLQVSSNLYFVFHVQLLILVPLRRATMDDLWAAATDQPKTTYAQRARPQTPRKATPNKKAKPSTPTRTAAPTKSPPIPGLSGVNDD